MLISILLMFSGCAPSSPVEFRKEGEALSRKFTKDLQRIESREALTEALPRIKKYFEEIVDLMIAAKNFQQEHFDEAIEPWDTKDLSASIALMEEMKRLYQFEGGRELIENAQREALFRFDAVLQKDKLYRK